MVKWISLVALFVDKIVVEDILVGFDKPGDCREIGVVQGGRIWRTIVIRNGMEVHADYLGCCEFHGERVTIEPARGRVVCGFRLCSVSRMEYKEGTGRRRFSGGAVGVRASL